VRKAGQGLSTFLQDIDPSDSGSLFKAVYSSGVIQRTLRNEEEARSRSVDKTMMSALAECYRAADSWEMCWQILSVIVDKLTLNQLQHWIPDLSQYRFTEARHHCLEYGRGAPVLTVPTPRMRVSTAQIDHFIAFITSPHIIQDLPFGKITIMLSTKKTTKDSKCHMDDYPRANSHPVYDLLPGVWVHATMSLYPSVDFEQVRCVCLNIGSRAQLC